MIAYELCLSTTLGWNWANRRRKYPLAEDVSPSENSRRNDDRSLFDLGIELETTLCNNTATLEENRGNLKETPGGKIENGK